MQAQEIFDKLKEKFGEEIIELITEETHNPFINVKPEKITDISLMLRDDEELDFDYLTLLSGIDEGENIGLVYHIYSTRKKHWIVIKTAVSKENCRLSSVERVWRAADWHERETYDMFGVIFEGHHNLIRILTPYDWEGWPLRKDYREPEEYHGMKVPY